MAKIFLNFFLIVIFAINIQTIKAQQIPASYKKPIALLYVENLTEREGIEKDFKNRLNLVLQNSSDYLLINEGPWQKILKDNKIFGLTEFFSILDENTLSKVGKLISADLVLTISIYTYKEEGTDKSSKCLAEITADLINVKKIKLLEITESFTGEIPQKNKIGDARNLAFDTIVNNLFTKITSALNKNQKLKPAENLQQNFPVIGNTQSNFYHLINVTHLPEKQFQKEFASEVEAKNNNFKPCPICFPQKNPTTLAITQIEDSLGQEASGLIEYLYRIKDDKKEIKKIASIAKKIIKQTPRHKLRYIFRIIDNDEINAFASPNGTIYFTQGLLDIVESDGELAGVIAHEISHIIKKHAVSQYNRGTKLAILGAVLTGGQSTLGVEFAQSLILNGYERKFEKEADKLAVIYMIKAGYSPDSFILMLKKLQDIETYTPSKIEIYFQTHPPTKERIETIQNFLKTKDGLITELDKLITATNTTP